MERALIFVILSFPIVVLNFFYFLAGGEQRPGKPLLPIAEILTILVTPLIFLSFSDMGMTNECCIDSAVFSPKHRISIYVAILLYTTAYVVVMIKESVLPPLAELLLNVFLVLGIVINILLCVHLNKAFLGGYLWILGNVPIIMLLIIRLGQRQRLIKHYVESNGLVVNNSFGKLALEILQLKPIIKYPVLLLLVLPVTIVLSLFLLMFGQKPDSLIRAFTDTYKHGFSQLDYMCDNANCGGHFLCSVGANGHREIVKPIRYGERRGNKIICNRQLLVSNAFEELLQERFPAMHLFIRKRYNKVGSFIHKYYHIFNIKWISDVVYILMKPLEWMFLLTLYTFDKSPENRIAKQYLSIKDRSNIEQILK